MSEGNNESLTPEVSKDSGAGKGLAKKVGDKALDKGKQMAQKAAKKGAAKGKLAVASGPVLFWAVVIIVAIIILVGIIMFFATMPGMVMEKLKQIFKDLGNYFAIFFGADTTKQIEPEQINETLDYLEDMGYDLKGYGFLTDYYTDKDSEDDIKSELSDNDKENYTLDSNIGVVRGGKGGPKEGKILLAKSDFIFTYITSDNYVYTLKNSNIATQNAAKSWLESLFAGFVSFFNKLFSPLIDLIGATEGIVDTWGRGLIVAWYEDGNRFGIKGDIVNTENWANHDTVKIDMENKTLVLAKNGWTTNNNPMAYSLDGWTGRYGMPLEFLLSIHVATMMPDLAYDMATSFNTNVNMYLHLATGEVKATYEFNGTQYDVSKIKDKGTIQDRVIYCIEQGLISEEEPCIIKYDANVYHYEWRNYTDELFGAILILPSPTNGKYYKAHVNKGIKIFDKNGRELTEEERKNIGDNVILMTKNSDTRSYYIVDKISESGKNLVYGYSFQIDELNHNSVQNKVEGVFNAVNNVPKSNYETYIPYIADVVNHWYRDVYFIMDTNETASKNFVKTDYDYESIYKERWTLYESYTDEDIKKLQPEYAKLYGELKLFLINEQGEYVTQLDNISSKKVVLDPAGTGYYVYLGTKQEAADEKIAVSKRAATFEVKNKDSYDTGNQEELKELIDLNWDTLENNNGIWSAYKVEERGRRSCT